MPKAQDALEDSKQSIWSDEQFWWNEKVHEWMRSEMQQIVNVGI